MKPNCSALCFRLSSLFDRSTCRRITWNVLLSSRRRCGHSETFLGTWKQKWSGLLSRPGRLSRPCWSAQMWSRRSHRWVLCICVSFCTHAYAHTIKKALPVEDKHGNISSVTVCILVTVPEENAIWTIDNLAVCLGMCLMSAEPIPRKSHVVAVWLSHPNCERKILRPADGKHKDNRKRTVSLCRQNKALS